MNDKDINAYEQMTLRLTKYFCAVLKINVLSSSWNAMEPLHYDADSDPRSVLS